MKPYDVICELVKDNFLYTSQPKIENLLPIDMVFHGYGAGGGVMPIVFEPHEDYTEEYKTGVLYTTSPSPHEDFSEGYSKRCDTDNEGERMGELIQANSDIANYNIWAREKNKRHIEEVMVTLPHDGKVYEAAELKLENKYYPTIREHDLWANSFRIASPHLSNPATELKIVTIDDEALYHLKESLDANEFVQRFNAGVFAYIQDRITQEKDLEAWGEDSVWYNPNKEFVHWFSSRGLDVAKIKHLEFADDRRKDIWFETYLELAFEARELVKKGDYATLEDAHQYMADTYWFHRKHKPVNPAQIGSEWRKAKSGGRIPDHLLDDDD